MRTVPGGDERAGRYGDRAHQWDPPRALDAAAWAWPARTVTGSRNGICARSLRPDLLDLVVAVLRAEPLELGAAGVVLGDPAGGERAVLDLGEDLLHGGPDVVVDDPRPGDVVAVLGRVADAEAHEVEAAAVHEVDDELQLVHRLEVGELGLVAGLHERLEGHLDEGRRAAAQDACSPKRSVSVSSANVVSRTPGARGARARGRRRGRGHGPSRSRPGGRRTGRARRRRRGRPSGRGGRGPSGRPSRRRSPAGGLIRPNRMLKPWANMRSAPGLRFGAISAS